MHFDPRAAKLLKSGEHLLVIGCQGLRLEGSVSRKAWTCRYKDAAGKMKQVKLGEWPTMGLGQATSVWQELRDKRGAGIDPVALKKEQAAGSSGVAVATVAQLVARFCDHPDRIRKQPSAKAARSALMVLLAQGPLFARTSAWLTESVEIQKQELAETRAELSKTNRAQDKLVENGRESVRLAALTALSNVYSNCLEHCQERIASLDSEIDDVREKLGNILRYQLKN